MQQLLEKHTPLNQRLMDWLFKGLPIPRKFLGEVVERKETCTICGADQSKQIGEVDYWDLGAHKIVQCHNCQHMELDPMLTDAETTKGCLAHHIEVALRESAVTQRNNALRNYRKGILFGFKLKKLNYIPRSVLELGPGSGYFSAGVQHVFKDVKVTVVDIVDVVLAHNARVHGFDTIKGTPENFELPTEQFDVVVARDILEHVTDIKGTIIQVEKLLASGGLFHFITPNGHCDVWRHYLRYLFKMGRSELLINHVNYFTGSTLESLLNMHGLQAVEYYTYQFKAIRRGGGWSLNPRKASPPSIKRSADAMILREQELDNLPFEKSRITRRWYFSDSIPQLTRAICFYHHYRAFKISPSRNLGHEIHGIFQKH